MKNCLLLIGTKNGKPTIEGLQKVHGRLEKQDSIDTFG